MRTRCCSGRSDLALLRGGYGGRVDIQLVQRAVRVVAGAVGIIRPRRMSHPAVERQPAVVAVVDPVAREVGIGSTSTDLEVCGEAGPTVGAERSPELRV